MRYLARCGTPVALLLTLMLVQPAMAQPAEPAVSEPAVPAKISTAMQDRDYQVAIAAIDATPDTAPDRDYLAFLKGRAYHYLENYDAAIRQYDLFAKQYDQSKYARAARFAKAASLARKGDYRAAELIYKGEAEYFLSEGRREEIAAVYLDFADSYFQPTDSSKEPNYETARTFYEKALETLKSGPRAVQVRLRIGQCYQHLGNFAEARKQFEAILENNPEHPLAIEAQYRLGQAHLSQGNLEQARRAWRDLLEIYTLKKSDRLPEAAFQLAYTYQLPNPPDEESLNLGIAGLRGYLLAFPGHQQAGKAHLLIAQSYINFNRHADAAEALRTFLADDLYADSEQIPEARFRLGQVYAAQEKFKQAEEAFKTFLVKHSTHRLWSAAQQDLVNLQYAEAIAAFREKNYKQARNLWTLFIAQHPLDRRHPAALYRLGQLDYIAGDYEAAIAAWKKLETKFPATESANRARFMIARTLQEKLQNYEEAIQQYRKVEYEPYKLAARRAIASLTTHSMRVLTPRVYRSDEVPQLKLTSRNIEKVTVRVYQIDLETYFRKMHLATGVEGLDVSLIDPDKQFEFEIPEYQEHRETSHRVALELPAEQENPGSRVMAVTVSSATLEATSLVVQSDLDVIVKSSRDEVFVFAQNMLTGKPWPGAEVLVSNGSEVFATGTTGDDGVFRGTYEELRSADDVRVLAIAQGHSASNRVGLGGVGVAQGLEAKGFLDTDRPAYRPGQMVHVRGIIRRVENDTFTVEEGKAYRVDVLDPRGRLVFESEVKLSRFGSFHSHLTLPSAAPQGRYRITVYDRQEREQYNGTFEVAEFKLEPVQLEIDTPRSVYYRGEEIEGVIRARYYYGAPLVGKQLRYRLADGKWFTATTDEKGEIAFKLPTREYRESRTLLLHAQFPERGLQRTEQLLLSARGFSISLETARDTYLQGETFELKATTRDAQGEPIGKNLKYGLYRVTRSAENELGEVLVHELEISSDVDSGIARVTTKVGKGGDYRLRVSGEDRFGNTVENQVELFISDDSDSTRLRILADRHHYKAGEEAKIRVHWRQQPTLALVTFGGARILDYRLVQLGQGENVLTVPMNIELAPNFQLDVCVMNTARELAAPEQDNANPNQVAQQPAEEEKLPRRFHQATSDFTVEQDLQVKLSVTPPAGAEHGTPGGDLQIKVETLDPAGNPVAAEVSLAMVEAALMQRFSSPLGSIAEFFSGRYRQPAMRTNSSVEFAYRPQTNKINPRLLAEQERLEMEADERRLAELFVNANQPSNRAGMNPFGGELVPDFDSLIELRSENLNGRPGDDVQRPFVTSIVPVVDPESPGAAGFGGGGFGFGGGGAFGTPSDDPFAAPQSESAPQRQANQPAMSWQGRQQRQNQLGSGEELSAMAESVELSEFVQNEELNDDLLATIGRLHGGGISGRGAVVRWFEKQVTDEQSLPILDTNGTFHFYGLAQELDGITDPQAAEKKALAFLANNEVLPQLKLNETGYWNPSIVTNDKGTATLTIQLPARSTQWKFVAKGIAVDTMAGEAEASLRTKQPLIAQLKLPQAFTEGDKALVTATIHNQAIAEGQIEVEFTSTIGGKKLTQSRKLNVNGKGLLETSFEVELALPDDASRSGAPDVAAEFELKASAGEHADTVAQTVPIRPHGMTVFSIAGGSARADTTAFLSEPEGMQLASRRLQILVSPSVEQSLFDAVLASPTWCQLETRQLASVTDQATSDLMAALALQRLVSQAAEEAGDPRAELLDQQVRSALRSLVATARDDGGFPWGGFSAESNPLATARAVWALQLADKAGYRIGNKVLAGAVNKLQDDLSKTATSDNDTKAVLLHALVLAGEGDFPLANQLYRNRQSLTPIGLAYLALGMAEMDRLAPAGDLLDLLAERDLSRPQVNPAGNVWHCGGSEAEVRALYALALQQAAPAGGRIGEQVEWLMAHRTGNRWSPDRATGPAMLAASAAQKAAAGEDTPYQLTVFVNNRKAGELTRDGDQPFETIEVKPELLKKEGRQEIRFQITGRGEYVYQCVMGGYVPADQLKKTADSWHVYRFYQPAGLELDGEEIPRGFDVVAGSYTSFRNQLQQLPVGSRGKVDLHITRTGAGSNGEVKDRSYLVITEPLPAGAVVLESSITGGYDRYEIGAGEIRFFVGNRRTSHIQFEIHGYLAGMFTAGPTIVRDAYHFDQFVISDSLEIDAPLEGSSITDDYRLSPRERYELGGRHFRKGRYAKAIEQLETLLDEWTLDEKYHRDAVRMLMEAHLQAGKPAGVVKNFEVIIEKYPDLEIPFNKFLLVGDAYHQIGEYERSYLVFRATVEASFFRESRAAGFLQAQDEPLRSVDLMASLVRQYPQESYKAEAKYALAQQVYALAPQAGQQPKLKEAKLTSMALTQRAYQMLDGFLTAYPQDPAADQAAFSAAGALLDMEAYDKTIALAERSVERYPQSEYRDSYWYIIGYSHYAQGEYEAALEMSRKVAEAITVDPRTGRRQESRNKWRAVYILGQIYHSLGQAEKAIEQYRKVSERFPDAAAAIRYFAHEEIKLPEVTTIKPGAEAKVKLSHRNVKQCEVAAYRIDLMKFSLLRRSLSGVTEINLAGIRPSHTQTIELGDGKDFRDRNTEITLPLKEEGAYFLICRAGNHYTTGLALITPLDLEVSEDATSGDVRTTVRNTLDEKFAADVHVKVIGSRNNEFDSGETDLRGVFAADGIEGRAMVIAQADGGKYAFYRGEQDLGTPPQSNTPAQQAAPRPSDGKATNKQQLLEGVKGGNMRLQSEQQQKLDRYYNNDIESGFGGGFGGSGGFF